MADLDLLTEHVRLSRRAGFRFGEAWLVALEALLPTMRATERSDWLYVLLTTCTVWERAYERRGRPFPLTANP